MKKNSFFMFFCLLIFSFFNEKVISGNTTVPAIDPVEPAAVSNLTVTITPPVGTTTFCTNTPYQFTGNANPGPILFWQWSCSPSAAVIIQFPNQNGTNITFTNAGSYTLTLIANNTSGVKDSVKFPLVVSPTPTITTSPIAPMICQGGTGTHLFVTGAATYTWSPLVNIATTYAAGDSINVNPPNLGVYTYTVVGTNAAGCKSAPATITATVSPPPTPILLVNPDTICSQTSSTLYMNGMPANATYTWSAAAAAGIGTNSGYYTPATPIYGHAVDTTFNYYVNVKVPGCPAYPTYTLNLVVIPTPTVTALSDTAENCNKKGDSLRVNSIPPASAGTTYHWTPGTGLSSTVGSTVFAHPLVPTTYYITPSYYGCVGKRDSIKMLIGDSTHAGITAEYHIICNGMKDTLIGLPALNQLNNTYHYSWSPPLGIIYTSVTKDTIVIKPTSTNVYTVTVTGTCVKSHSSQITIAVNACVKPVPSYSVTFDTICVNHCVWFTDLTQNSTVRPLFYQWIFTGGSPVAFPGSVLHGDTLTYAATDSAAIPKIKVCYHINSSLNTGGVFPVKETVADSIPGQVGVHTGTIAVDQGPLANAGPNPTINLGDNTTLHGSLSSGNFGISTYTWTPSTDLSCTACPNPVANPSVTTQYYLTVMDKNGCKSTDSMTVFVDLVCFTPFVPSAFSPNNDKENDILYVRSNCLTNFTFKVYDRWGEKVFETNELHVGWDGTLHGSPMNIGVFVYTLEGFLSNGKEVKQKGNITLVR